eukprot:5785071-Amphidinium_carterae.1
MIRLDVCSKRHSTYRCLPDVAKVEALIKSGKSLEFSYNPHSRDELIRIYAMMTEADDYEWLIPQRPDTPKSEPQPADAIQDVPDVPMVQGTEDPYYDEEEQEIARLKA